MEYKVASRTGSESNAMNVFLVDDDPDIPVILTVLLREAGYSVASAADD
jgi:CheY-like chemotaxis protein